jgi:hypothetical protein
MTHRFDTHQCRECASWIEFSNSPKRLFFVPRESRPTRDQFRQKESEGLGVVEVMHRIGGSGEKSHVEQPRRQCHYFKEAPRRRLSRDKKCDGKAKLPRPLSSFKARQRALPPRKQRKDSPSTAPTASNCEQLPRHLATRKENIAPDRSQRDG